MSKETMLKLSEWLEEKSKEEPIIFVDQDHTLLLLTDPYEVNVKGGWMKENAIIADIMGRTSAIIPRPNAHMFLSECRRMAKVYVLTAGTTQFQMQVLESVQMLDIVDGVYGRDIFYTVPKVKKGILIDNLPHNHANSEAKLEAMGGGLFLLVPDWTGNDPKDTVLLDILPKIRKMLF